MNVLSIDYVIESGTVSWLEHVQSFGFWQWVMVLFCCAFASLIGSAFCMFPFAISESNDTEVFEVVAFCVAYVFLFGFIFFALTSFEANDISPEGWKENIAQPYYEELPLITKEIDIISVSGTNDPEIFEIVYSEKNANGSLVNETVTSKIVKEDKRSNITYEYKEIIMDIPNFMEQGRYEEVIRVPLNFSFSQK